MDENFFFNITRYSGIHRAFRPFYSGIGCILMFHRIVENTIPRRIEKNRKGKISTGYLESIITYGSRLKYKDGVYVLSNKLLGYLTYSGSAFAQNNT
jgi:hypothetical protein